MRAFARTAFVAGLTFGVPFGTFAGVVLGLIFGSVLAAVQLALAVGVGSGLLFGGAIATVVAFQRRRLLKSPPNLAHERVLHDGPANRFLNGEVVGGWLFLTDRRLLFRPHELNLQRGEESIALQEIAAVETFWVLKLVPNGLRVITRSGEDERFYVEAPKEWRDAIRAASPLVTSI